MVVMLLMINFIFTLNITDLIALSSLINKYAPNRPDGGKMKIGTHADQGEASSKSSLIFTLDFV